MDIQNIYKRAIAKTHLDKVSIEGLTESEFCMIYHKDPFFRERINV